MFKNLCVFRLPAAATPDVLRLLDEALTQQHPLRSCSPLEQCTRGLVPLFNAEGAPTSLKLDETLLVTVGSETREVQAAALKTELTKRARAREIERGSPVIGKALRRLREEIRSEMLAHAYVQRMDTQGFIDLRDGWVVVDTSSTKHAENYLSTLRNVLDSLPAVPLSALAVGANDEGSQAAVVLMTHWLTTGNLPQGLGLGESCELRDEAGAIARLSRQDLHTDEVRELLRAGKVVTKLELVFDERMVFTLGHDLVLRKLKLLDVVPLPDGDGTALGNFCAEAALTVAEIHNLLQRLEHLLHIRRPENDEHSPRSPTQRDLFVINGFDGEGQQPSPALTAVRPVVSIEAGAP